MSEKRKTRDKELQMTVSEYAPRLHAKNRGGPPIRRGRRFKLTYDTWPGLCSF